MVWDHTGAVTRGVKTARCGLRDQLNGRLVLQRSCISSSNPNTFPYISECISRTEAAHLISVGMRRPAWRVRMPSVRSHPMSASRRFSANSVTSSFSTCAVDPAACSRALQQSAPLQTSSSASESLYRYSFAGLIISPSPLSWWISCKEANHSLRPIHRWNLRQTKRKNKMGRGMPQTWHACWPQAPRAQHRRAQWPAPGRSGASSRCQRHPASGIVPVIHNQ